MTEKPSKTPRRKDLASTKGATPTQSTYLGEKNPFRVPKDRELFAYHEKMHMERGNPPPKTATVSPRKEFRELCEAKANEISAEEAALAQLILSPDVNEKKPDLHGFIDEKREIFLEQLGISTKQEELQRLERLEREEEESLKAKEAEISLFKDQFTTFLQNDGKSTLDARIAAEAKAKERLDLSMTIKSLSAQNSSLRGEIAHHEERLKECLEYKKFLDSLTPADWKGESMYFTDPNQLLEIIKTLEGQNMFLLRHCQDAEEAVERTRGSFDSMLESRDSVFTELEEKRKQLKQPAEVSPQNSSFKEGNELTAEEYSQISTQISDFCISGLGLDASASKDIISMLTKIEAKMEEVSQILDRRDQQLVKEFAVKKEKQRRESERVAKQEAQKKLQNDKRQRALLLAKKPIIKKCGRPLIARTVPTHGKSKQEREEMQKRLKMLEEADKELLFGDIYD